ncbi:transporter [Fluviibacterium sp. DFM31]|uniref:Transporter n=1 Tax=Meridianimarinicoccus marinus TaxID=3231483 RepID=A0ABV3L5M9_9RHOB
MILFRLFAALIIAFAITPLAVAQSDKDADLAKKLSNPVADLISVPFQLNYNEGYASGDGEQWQLNIQPVIPISISHDWNLISRTILPVISQDGVIPGEGDQFGFGATTQSFFFSPKAPTRGGLIWGVGPVLLIPTATDGIATNQWGAGLTGVALTQRGPWTVGGLANHIWSVTGNDKDGKISASFLQPFVSYTTPKATSFTLNTESTYDWEDKQWSVPVNALIGQVVELGAQPVQFSLGARYWAESPDNGPDGWGARFQMTFLFPK